MAGRTAILDPPRARAASRGAKARRADDDSPARGPGWLSLALGVAEVAAVAGVTWVDGLLGLRRSNGSKPEVKDPARVQSVQTTAVNRTPQQIYAFWRDFRNLPRFLRHLEAVRPRGERRSHWIARGPAGARIEWEAELTADEPGRRLAWRSVAGSDVDTAGTVTLEPMPGDRGTLVRVDLQYHLLGAAAAATTADIFGAAPEQRIRDDLRRLKQLLETGEIATTEGQPRGRSSLGTDGPVGTP